MRKYNPTNSKVSIDENGNVKFTYEAKVKEEGPCWPGYKQVGTKMKNGKEVPNCVPIDEADETDDQRKAKFASGAAGGPNSSSKRKKVDEAPLVMSDMDIVKSLTQKIEDDLHKLKVRKQFEKGWSTVQLLAKLAGYKVTKTAQAKGKTFRYDLKK